MNLFDLIGRLFRRMPEHVELFNGIGQCGHVVFIYLYPVLTCLDSLFVSGVIDSDTLKKMKTPRCGMKDHIHLDSGDRKKRYAAWEGKKTALLLILFSLHYFILYQLEYFKIHS